MLIDEIFQVRSQQIKHSQDKIVAGVDEDGDGCVGAVADVAEGGADDEDEDSDQREAILDVGDGENDGGEPEAENGLQSAPEQDFFAETSAQSDNEPFAYRIEIAQQNIADALNQFRLIGVGERPNHAHRPLDEDKDGNPAQTKAELIPGRPFQSQSFGQSW